MSFASFGGAAAADCTEASGTVTCTHAALAAGASVDWTINVGAFMTGTPVNVASITSNASPDSDTSDDTASALVTIVPNAMSTDVAAGDPDWQNQIDGVDVLFQKSGTSTYTLKATNPGTFKYRLSLTNETGVDVHVRGRQLPDIIRNGVAIKDANGGTTTVFLTVPSMPSSTGTPYPLSDAQTARCRPSCCPGTSPCGLTRTTGPTTCRSASRISPRPSRGRPDPAARRPTGYLPLPVERRQPRRSAASGLTASRSASTTRRTIHVAYEFRWKNNPVGANWGSSTVDPSPGLPGRLQLQVQHDHLARRPAVRCAGSVQPPAQPPAD